MEAVIHSFRLALRHPWRSWRATVDEEMRFAFCALTGTLLFAAATAHSAENAEVKVHQRGSLRAFYHVTGEDAVLPEDRNQNGVPDQVEDALIQIEAAQLFYCRILGYPDPLKSKRYEGAAFLDVHFRKKETLQGNGKAYDELQRSARPGDSADMRVLRIGVATSVRPTSNPTPAHEFFHAIQNGATYFKNRWYTEGTARWSESPFDAKRVEVRKVGLWPLTPEKIALLVEMSYDAAAYFWKPLVARYDAEGAIPASGLTEQLAAITYVNGEKVWKNQQLPGWKLIRSVLNQFDAADDAAAADLKVGRWTEECQRSSQNDRFILGAIEKAIGERD